MGWRARVGCAGMLSPIIALLVAAPLSPPAEQRLAREIFQELVEIDTTHTGSTTTAAEAVARRLRAAGWGKDEVQVFGPSPRKGNLVARLRGTGKRKPLLLLGHLDVVAAKRDDWSLDPFKLTERDGYYYGRGTEDMKSLVAMWVATVIRFKKEGYRPDRDLILALTADEENGDENGVVWLLAHHRPLIEAAYALNEGGSGEIKDGRYRANDVQASEKQYLSYRLEVRNKGGHSSLPERENAIVRLADAVGKVHRHEFPARLNAVTRAYFQRMAKLETGATAADMRAVADGPTMDPGAVARLSATAFYNARLRTTCVPTLIEGGHAENALPQKAVATINCRALPDESPAEVQRTLVTVIGDAAVKVEPVKPPDGGPPSPLLPELMSALEAVTGAMWPGVVVLPVMQPGATDGRFLRAAGIPTFGVSGLFRDVADIRAHGRDERIPVRSFQESQEFVYRLLRALTS
jgi:acetylornithine deacetylase/succinyl-diaminopimelate desuccinylase-like protein